MSWLGIALGIVKLLLSKWLTNDAEKKKRKEECYNEVKKGIKAKDPSRITAAFDRVRTLG